MKLTLLTCLSLVFVTRCRSTLSSSQYEDSDLRCHSSSTKVLVGAAIDLLNKVTKSSSGDAKNCPERPVDCEEVLQCGQSTSGVYDIWPRSRLIDGRIQVYCDMVTTGGGWTVIQRRGDFGHSKDYFYRTWDHYKTGFGGLKQDFWLGNDIIHAITNQRQYSIRFDLKDLEGETRFATYDYFWIDNEDYNYTLHVTGYSGNAGDSFGGHRGGQFSTKDRDNDIHASGSCAISYKGAWWYKVCHSSNLNGYYLNGTHSSYADGIEWSAWRGQNYSLPWTEMKVRSTVFSLGVVPQ